LVAAEENGEEGGEGVTHDSTLKKKNESKRCSVKKAECVKARFARTLPSRCPYGVA